MLGTVYCRGVIPMEQWGQWSYSVVILTIIYELISGIEMNQLTQSVELNESHN